MLNPIEKFNRSIMHLNRSLHHWNVRPVLLHIIALNNELQGAFPTQCMCIYNQVNLYPHTGWSFLKARHCFPFWGHIHSSLEFPRGFPKLVLHHGALSHGFRSLGLINLFFGTCCDNWLNVVCVLLFSIKVWKQPQGVPVFKLYCVFFYLNICSHHTLKVKA